jgi:hypothetical protein
MKEEEKKKSWMGKLLSGKKGKEEKNATESEVLQEGIPSNHGNSPSGEDQDVLRHPPAKETKRQTFKGKPPVKGLRGGPKRLRPHPPKPPLPEQGDPPDFSGSPVIKIKFFPNTGHHFLFIPGVDLGLGTNSKISDWENLMSDQDREARWARYRWGVKDGIPGAWICIETNIGDNTRGSVLITREDTENRGSKPTRQETPYITDDQTFLGMEGECHNLYLCPDHPGTALAKIEVSWKDAGANNPINVDIIVDFGNTRTVVLLNEEPTVAAGVPPVAQLASIVKKVPFLSRDEIFTGEEKDRHIVNSWFMVHEPQFASREPPTLQSNDPDAIVEEVLDINGNVDYLRKRLPQMFVEMSPVVIGKDAENTLNDINLEDGGRCFLGSPKRYVWDNEKLDDGVTEFWFMVENLWSKEGKKLSKMAGNVLRFFPPTGVDWDFDNPPNERPPIAQPPARPDSPLYPNADAMAWMALAIIENAYRIMNNPDAVKDAHPNILRKLRSIKVTHPSGWTLAEIEAYKSKWQKAVNAFTRCHFPIPSQQPPELEFPIDEAVASQLPIVFSEIENMHGLGDNWLKLIGRPAPPSEDGKESSYRARVMTIDIGGGTTDYSIIEYEDKRIGPGVLLEAKLLYKDSTTIAGDEMVKKLIEQLLLPKMGHKYTTEEDRDNFKNVFAQSVIPREIAEWRRITRLLLIPKIHQWLEALCNGQEPSADDSFFLSNHEMVVGILNKYMEKNELPNARLFESDDIQVSEMEISTVIKETFEPLFQTLPNYVTAFDVDLVVVCGKPSEIPKIGEMLRKYLPLPKERIVMAKGFPAGDWYPFNKAGKIVDAKTVTAVGVALKAAIDDGKVGTWRLNIRNSDNLITNNYWMLMPAAKGGRDTEILNRDQEENLVDVLVNARIGRRLLPNTNTDPVYIVKWIDTEKSAWDLKIGIRRKYVSTMAEELELISAIDNKTEEDVMDRVQLKLCTLQDNAHWIDNPGFTVDF